MIRLVWNEKGVWAEDDESIKKLEKNFFGEKVGKKIKLYPEEVLYALNFLNAVCTHNGRKVGFNEIASFFSQKNPRILITYNAYRDWRDRGLVIRKIDKSIKTKHSSASLHKKYPSKPLEFKKLDIEAVWYPESMFSIVEDESVGLDLFNNYWFGQYGVYRQERGTLLKLNFLETIFLAKYFNLKVKDSVTNEMLTYKDIMDVVIEKREWTKQLYEVYEDWRLAGYIVKTGFKFGSHFRIYFPGASPTLSPKKTGEKRKWIHSKHVLHVFPKEQKLLISEWARAVRVAHSVKKTFLLSIPKLAKKDIIDYPLEFVSYRRKKKGKNWVRENPQEDKPRYLLVPFSEDEHIGGVELASLLKKAEEMNLRLILSITDRETAITYYVLNKIVLPDSRNEYYEIEWMKP